jgi:predicted regulator of Ras-like GTPase activity (Roadblock/LC7/MglB family)
MSVVRIKFAGFLRGLLRRFDDDEPVAPKPSRPVSAAPRVAAVPPPAVLRQPVPPAPEFATPPPATAKPDEIRLAVTSILTALPLDLRAKIVGANTVGMMISLSAEKVLAQLATGSVKITFGELRQLAPGVFASFSGECDAKLVVLPLNQILAQINPALLSRRSAAQKPVEISDDITSPFSAGARGLKISTGQVKAPPAPIPMPRPAPVAEIPAPRPPVAQPPPAFTPRWTTPSTNGNGHANGHANGAPHAPNFSAAPVPPATAAPIPPMAALPEQSQPTIFASLGELAETWPEALRQEIELLDLQHAQVALPVHLVEPALKRGRVIFSWRYLRSWIQSAAVAVSVHDGLELELPLKVLAPLFFTQRNGAAKTQKKAAVSEEIPNLFFGLPQPEPAPVPQAPIPMPASTAAPVPDTNFFTRANQPQTSDSEFRRKGGTDFLSRAATPSEVVFRAMELPTVAGAIIALPDGLKVASQIPEDLNADTLAAFIPQIFARVKQCSQELRMGEMNNLSFTVGNVPWKIFRVNAVYFAAFGRANESLPGAQLATLAGSLDRKKI